MFTIMSHARNICLSLNIEYISEINKVGEKAPCKISTQN